MNEDYEPAGGVGGGNAEPPLPVAVPVVERAALASSLSNPPVAASPYRAPVSRGQLHATTVNISNMNVYVNGADIQREGVSTRGEGCTELVCRCLDLETPLLLR